MTLSRTLRIGTRGSRLALWQAEHVKSLIQSKFPNLNIQITVIRTTGDKNLDSPLSLIGGKGVFVKEIEEALLSDTVHIAVHSMKDLPAILAEGLTIGAVAERHDPRDAFISEGNIGFRDLPHGAKIGTGSLRRQAQILALRPDLQIVPIRGNIDTRLKKLKSEGLDAILLALAGLERIGFGDRITELFPTDVIVPAPGQGIIAIECRTVDTEVREILSQINHTATSITASAERAFLESLGGGCQAPAGCNASIKEDEIHILGLIASPDGKEVIRERVVGKLEDAESMGHELARKLLDTGGKEILSKLIS